MKFFLTLLALLPAALVAQAAAPASPAATSMPLPYGAPITLVQARTVLAAAQAEAIANKWAVVIAIVDTGGHLVLLERMDVTQYGSVEVALGKATTSAAFRRPSKAFQDLVAAGGEGLRTLSLPGATPIEGGLPLIHEGRIIGAIGISGVTSVQDGQIARAGAAVLAPKS
jgi:glc operon protein GlcG